MTTDASLRFEVPELPPNLDWDRLAQVYRHALTGFLTGSLAHDAGTPLNVIIGRAQMLGRGLLKGDKLVRSTSSIEDQARKMSDRFQGVVHFVRSRDVPATGSAIAAGLVSLFEPHFHRRRIECTVSGDAERALEHRAALQLSVAALLHNAVLAAERHITVELSDDRIVVGDDGPGFGALSEAGALFTSAWEIPSSGIGLPLTAWLASNWGGTLEVTSAPGATRLVLAGV